MAEDGYQILAYDRKGFGSSEGIRGDHGDRLLEEFREFIQKAEQKYDLKDTKKFLMGYSLGGLLSSRLVQEEAKLVEK